MKNLTVVNELKDLAATGKICILSTLNHSEARKVAGNHISSLLLAHRCPPGVRPEARASRPTPAATPPVLLTLPDEPGARACVRGEGGEPKIPTALPAGVDGGACEAKGWVGSKGG